MAAVVHDTKTGNASARRHLLILDLYKQTQIARFEDFLLGERIFWAPTTEPNLLKAIRDV